MEKLLAKKGDWKVYAQVIADEQSNFLHIEGPKGLMSSIEVFEVNQGFEDDRGYMVSAPKGICEWVERNVEGWYEEADRMLEQAA